MTQAGDAMAGDAETGAAGDLTSCRRTALLIVFAMVVGACAVAALLNRADGRTRRALRSPWTLGLSTVVVIAALFAADAYIAVPLLLIPLWSSLFLVDLRPENRASAARAVIIFLAVILLALGGGLLVDFYSGWTNFLYFALLALVVSGLIFMFLPLEKVQRRTGSDVSGDSYVARAASRSFHPFFAR